VLGNFSGATVAVDVPGWDGAELVLGNVAEPVVAAQLAPWEARIHRR
jgi:hypothetical protein